MDTVAEDAIGTGHDVLAFDHAGKIPDTPSDERGMLDPVSPHYQGASAIARVGFVGKTERAQNAAWHPVIWGRQFRRFVVKRSTDRILTTHAGSLPRPDDLLEMIVAKSAGKAVDEAKFMARVRRAVSDVVRQQIETGIDIVADGEMGKPSFLTYVADRLGGFEPDKAPPGGSPFAQSREFKAFPEAYAALARSTVPAAGPIRSREPIPVTSTSGVSGEP
jgi:hypothetical protein